MNHSHLKRIILAIAAIFLCGLSGAGQAEPTATALITDDPTPIISGTFDAANSTTLTVSVNSVTYTLGTNTELSTADNTWTLDLSGISPLAVGTYDVVVTATDALMNSSHDVSTNELVINNVTPVITGQTPLITPKDTPLTIALANLTVTDPDNTYSTGFTLNVQAGTDYTVSGATITPATGFTGSLTVPVTVNDGNANSAVFNLTVSVIENGPSPCGIPAQSPGTEAAVFVWKNCTTGKWSMRVTAGGGSKFYSGSVVSSQPFSTVTPVSVEANDTLNYTTDPRQIVYGLTTTSTYQDGFDFSFPASAAVCFNVNLPAGATVYVGTARTVAGTSFNLANLGACPVPNVAPEITGQVALSTAKDTALPLTLGNLTVADPDNSYPTGFTLSVQAGSNYTVVGTTITPAASFVGTLTVPVTVNDGTADSAVFNLAVAVFDPTNVAPEITGQAGPLSTAYKTALMLTLNDLLVDDPDNTYPVGFTLSVQTGANYTVSGTTITPATGFSGTLTVPVTVNDGNTNSASFDLSVVVAASANVAPVITGQLPLSTVKDTALTLDLSNLTVTDPDNSYPTGFTLSVQPGANYAVSGVTITPATGFAGVLSVPVTVNDGNTDSAIFILAVTVTTKPPTVNINNVTVAENVVGGLAKFTVSLSVASPLVVTVNVATANGTAIAPGDYVALPLTTLIFVPGQTSKSVTVAVINDVLAEGPEKFSMILSNAVNGVLGVSTKTGTITDNEPSPCNAPTYSAGTEAAMFLWKNCTTGIWSMRVTAGGGSLTYKGTVTAGRPFSTMQPFSVEPTAGDVLTLSPDTRINYTFKTSTTATDGVDFSYPSTTTACVRVTAPTSAKVYVGKVRKLVTTAFDLGTLGACIVDTVAPKATVSALITSDPTPALTGTVDDPTATLVVTIAGTTYAATNNGNGTWTLVDNVIATQLSEGIYEVALTATDAAGNIGNDTSLNELEIGTPPSLADTVRFLEQASFGPTDALVTEVLQKGFSRWLEEQFTVPATGYTPYTSLLGYPVFTYYPLSKFASTVPCVDQIDTSTVSSQCFRDNYTPFRLKMVFYQNALKGPDQLRQRVAFALSQLMVVSGVDINMAYGMRNYQQMLLNMAFGNYRNLLYNVTLSPVMGQYLDMVDNGKSQNGIEPNENYARELLQLFSIGTDKLNPDGTPVLDALDNRIPAYDQDVVEGIAHVFTGWTFPPRPGKVSKTRNPPNYDGLMVVDPANHESGVDDFGQPTKVLFDGNTLPPYQTPEQDLNDTIDAVFNHSNVGPFVAKQLIQKLVTGNPSPAYVARVASVFNANTQGVRGDMKAVVKAILLDTEARGDLKTDPSYGHLKEPVLYITNIMRILGAQSDGEYLTYGSRSMLQDVFMPPTVFNYYPPDHVLPDATPAPEFAILDASTTLQRSNFVNTIVFFPRNRPELTGVAPSAIVSGAIGTTIDWTPWLPLVTDPAQLVDKLDALMLHNTLSAAARDVILQAVMAVPATDPLRRARTAFYLIATSPQYQVER